MSELYEPLKPHEFESYNELDKCLGQPLTCSLVCRIFLLLLQVHYSSASNYPDEFKHLRGMVWSPDDQASTLSVDTLNHFDDNRPDCFPGIYVGKASVQYSSQVLGNFAGENADGSRQHLVEPAVFNSKIVHVVRNEGDASDMAEMSGAFLRAMAPILAGEMGASSIRVNSVGNATRKLSGSDRFYAVDLSVTVTYNDRVATILEGHRISAIQIAVKSTELPST